MLLRRLDEADFNALAPHLSETSIGRGGTLNPAEETIDTTYFIESGVCSLVLTSPDDRVAEIGIVGPEGVVGASPIIGVYSVPHSSFMQVAGRALKLPAETLCEIVQKRPAIALMIARFRHVLAMQAIQTALANAHYTVEERLARWLLMCQDRLGSNEIELTHDFLSTMLSVRRSTVTLATHNLEGAGLIRAQRGRITVVKRKELAALAAGSYGMPEEEYERILGPLRT
ncbi:Crp/Fnr family transcriptional regulator [Fulvimarina pelagi]|uniref:Crp/Fnr family transcriptional regulator n=1 Tax=Fulvimarina pelagi TaxID=217511 RepID=UPI001FCB404A|nr:Crp/Fnr family transcriptional regulator [Fulvimarina pelagi]